MWERMRERYGTLYNADDDDDDNDDEWRYNKISVTSIFGFYCTVDFVFG